MSSGRKRWLNKASKESSNNKMKDYKNKEYKKPKDNKKIRGRCSKRKIK